MKSKDYSNKLNHPKNKLKFLLVLISFTLILVQCSKVEAKGHTQNNINVVFINPSSVGNPYWDFISNTMEKAASDFGMNLKVLNTDRQDLHNAQPLIHALNSMEKPDYLIYIYQQRLGIKLLEFAEKNQIKSFILNTGISDKDRIKIGKPTEVYKYWIGHSYPNLADVAYQLSNDAYSLAKRKLKAENNNGIYSVVMSGSRDTDVSKQWNEGAQRSSAEIDDYHIKQIIYTDFDASKGYEQIKKLLVRYPEVSVFMSVDENVAMSAIRAAQEVGRKPGEDIFITCSAALQPALEMVALDKLTASYALSIWSGVYSIIYLNDYHQGIISAQKERVYNYSDTIISQDEIPIYHKIMSKSIWQHIDYKVFSGNRTEGSTKYDFSAQAFKRALQTVEINHSKIDNSTEKN